MVWEGQLTRADGAHTMEAKTDIREIVTFAGRQAARAFFVAADERARQSRWEIGTETWFVRPGKRSIHRDEIFGYLPTYDLD